VAIRTSALRTTLNGGDGVLAGTPDLRLTSVTVVEVAPNWEHQTTGSQRAGHQPAESLPDVQHRTHSSL